MFTDLQMLGFSSDEEWNNENNPFFLPENIGDKVRVWLYAIKLYDDKEMLFMNHNAFGRKEYKLTEQNYLQVLQKAAELLK